MNQGLWFLSSNACSVHTDAFIDHAAPLERRLVGVEAVYALYRDLFVTRCSPELLHGRRTGKPAGNPLNSVCFMFWDIGSLLAADEAPMQAAILDVLQRIAKLGHVACIEGAVHGLGHAALCGYVEASGILDNMISSSSCPSEIIPYARKAKPRMVTLSDDSELMQGSTRVIRVRLEY